MNQLMEYKKALTDNNENELKKLLVEGKICKEEVDGR